jgi:hypothetical protein
MLSRAFEEISIETPCCDKDCVPPMEDSVAYLSKLLNGGCGAHL